MTRHRQIVLVTLTACVVALACAFATLVAMWRLAPAARASDGTAIAGLRPLPSGRPISVIAVAWGKRENKLALLTPDGRHGVIVVDGRNCVVADPVWSPDGRYIAYTLVRYPWATAHGRLWVYDTATRRPIRFDPGVATLDVRGYTWISPTEFVVSTFRHRPPSHTNGFLVRHDVRDGSSRPLTDARGTPLVGVFPDASADGRQVAFLTFDTSLSGSRGHVGEVLQKIELLDLDSGSVTPVAEEPAIYQEVNGIGDLRLSPDGRYVFAVGLASDVGFYPSVYPTGGGTPARQNWDQMYGGAAWDPTGAAHLVVGGAHGVDTPPFAGTLVWWEGDRRLRTGMTISGATTGLCWSPSGDRLAYSVIPKGASWPGTPGSLWVASADGRQRHLVARQATSPAWAVVTFPD